MNIEKLQEALQQLSIVNNTKFIEEVQRQIDEEHQTQKEIDAAIKQQQYKKEAAQRRIEQIEDSADIYQYAALILYAAMMQYHEDFTTFLQQYLQKLKQENSGDMILRQNRNYLKAIDFLEHDIHERTSLLCPEKLLRSQ